MIRRRGPVLICQICRKFTKEKIYSEPKSFGERLHVVLD
jgi:hypothetical protein